MDQAAVLSASITPEVLPNLPTELSPVKAKRIPRGYTKNEKPEYLQMYTYYEKLGNKRSLRKVAKEFGRSTQHVAILSRTFGWGDRVRQADSTFVDPITTLSKPTMDNARLDIVGVVSEITIILSEMTSLAKSIRKGCSDEMCVKDKTKMKSLINALAVYGIRIRTPKDLRDMVGTLKDVMQFNKDSAPAVKAENNKTQVNVNEMNLIIKDD